MLTTLTQTRGHHQSVCHTINWHLLPYPKPLTPKFFNHPSLVFTRAHDFQIKNSKTYKKLQSVTFLKSENMGALQNTPERDADKIRPAETGSVITSGLAWERQTCMSFYRCNLNKWAFTSTKSDAAHYCYSTEVSEMLCSPLLPFWNQFKKQYNLLCLLILRQSLLHEARFQWMMRVQRSTLLWPPETNKNVNVMYFLFTDKCASKHTVTAGCTFPTPFLFIFSLNFFTHTNSPSPFIPCNAHEGNNKCPMLVFTTVSLSLTAGPTPACVQHLSAPTSWQVKLQYGEELMTSEKTAPLTSFVINRNPM